MLQLSVGTADRRDAAAPRGFRLNFYLGAPHLHWLERAQLSLFVSHRRLAAWRRRPARRHRLGARLGRLTELRLHGVWRTAAADYVAAARRYCDEIGNLEWAAPMDWMCEPFMLAKTGLRVGEPMVCRRSHQHRRRRRQRS